MLPTRLAKQLLSLAGLLIFCGSSQAALINIQATIEIDSIDSRIPASDIALGDQFVYDLVIDDQVTDSNASDTAGFYTDAVKSFSVSAVAGNTGSWDPSSGTLDTGLSVLIQNTRLQIISSGPGFPSFGGDPLLQLSFQLRTLIGFDPSGTGNTLRDAIGGVLPNDLSDYNYTFGRFDNTNFEIAFAFVNALSVTETQSIPEPYILSLLGPVLILMLRRVKKA